MTAPDAGMPSELFRLHTNGWIVSLCLHGSALFLAGLFVAQIGLAPPSSLFHWDVTVIGTHNPIPALSAPNTPIASSKTTRPVQRSIASSVTGNPRAFAPSQNTSASASTVVTTRRPPADSVSAQHSHQPRPALEQPPAVSVPEQQESANEQRIQQQTTSLPTDPPAESYPPLLTPVPPSTEATPASRLSAHSLDPQHIPGSSTVPDQVASPEPSSPTTPVARKPDYGWLADTLLHRIDELKQYPASARLSHVEGRVIVRIVIEEGGQIASVAIATSSGHDVLDQAALETLRRASPISLSRPLEKSPVTIQIPLSYRLGQ